MTPEPVWITLDEVISINEVLVASTGEKHFLRDMAALQGALNRPISYFQYEARNEVHFLAAYLVLAIGKSHAFEQGNKRTAWAAGRLFLHNNGYRIDWQAERNQVAVADTIAEMMVDEMMVKHLIDWLDRLVVPIT